MTNDDLLVDGFGRVREGVHRVLEGCTPEMLAYRPDAAANPIGWLVWHLTRVQDDHVAEVAGSAQVWATGSWADRFGLPYKVSATGWSQTAEEVGQFPPVPAELLAGYHDAVHAATVDFLGTFTDADLRRIVDRSFDPPVTLAVRLVSVLSDDLEHVGQAAYVRGLAERA